MANMNGMLLTLDDDVFYLCKSKLEHHDDHLRHLLAMRDAFAASPMVNVQSLEFRSICLVSLAVIV